MFIVVPVLTLLCCCTKGGNISQVTQTIENSSIYTEQDIKNAMNVVTAYFKNAEDFQYCTLTELCYNETISSNTSEVLAEQYEAEEGIILISSFDVGAENKHSGLEANRTYNNFKWILVRSNGRAWTLETWGY